MSELQSLMEAEQELSDIFSKSKNRALNTGLAANMQFWGNDR